MQNQHTNKLLLVYQSRRHPTEKKEKIKELTGKAF